MRLNRLQMVWFVGTILFFVAVVLDVANVVDLPGMFLLLAPIALFALSVAVGPSFKEINEALKRSKRRGGRRS